MVSVIGPVALPEPPLLLPQAAAARATAARPAASLSRRVFTRRIFMKCLPFLGPADDRFDELPVLGAGRGKEVQVAALWCLLNGAGVQRGPAAQVGRCRGRPGRGPAGQLVRGHLK